MTINYFIAAVVLTVVCFVFGILVVNLISKKKRYERQYKYYVLAEENCNYLSERYDEMVKSMSDTIEFNKKEADKDWQVIKVKLVLSPGDKDYGMDEYRIRQKLIGAIGKNLKMQKESLEDNKVKYSMIIKARTDGTY